MSPDLPKPIAAYLASEKSHDTAAVTACFAEEATVRDEGRTIQGVPAIKEWKEASKRKYQHSVEVIDAAQKDGKTVVRGLVSGNFPGSPIELQFAFTIVGDKIASLEIR